MRGAATARLNGATRVRFSYGLPTSSRGPTNKPRPRTRLSQDEFDSRMGCGSCTKVWGGVRPGRWRLVKPECVLQRQLRRLIVPANSARRNIDERRKETCEYQSRERGGGRRRGGLEGFGAD